MANLTPVQSRLSGVAVAYAAVGGSGDQFRYADHLLLRVKNGSGVSTVCTVTVPGTTPYAQPNPDIPITIAAGAEYVIGPFQRDLVDPADGWIKFACSPSASITCALVRN